MDVSRLDLILRYALAVSHEALGPIHLLKYAYLADLAYADQHGGETFTGVPWRFLQFGPFATEVLDRIEPIAEAMGAEKKVRERKEDGREYTRYQLGDDALAEKLRDQLPVEVATAVRHGVQEHGGDTASLLESVYLTDPMLRAAPGEFLDFKAAAKEPEAPAELNAEEISKEAPWKVRKASKETLNKAKEAVRRKLQEKRDSRPRPSGAPPRYDEVYVQGLKWLDALAGEPLKEAKDQEVHFPSDIWKSPSRRGPGGS
jgi:hypothetical protein